MGDQINVRSSSQHLVVTPSTKSVAVVMTGPMGPGVGGGPGTGVPTFSEIVLKAGDTMTGFLVLSGDPEADFHAATKRWVEEYVAENAPASTGPDTQGFTFFQSSTPVATRIGDTWFDTGTGEPKTWDGFIWFPYALYPGGGAMSGLLIAARNSDANAVDGTGALQIGESGGPNIGIDTNEIQGRNGGAGSSLHLNLEGGLVTIAESLLKLYSDTNQIQMERTSTQFVWEGAGPNGFQQAAYSGDGGALYFRTTPQSWFFEAPDGDQILQVRCEDKQTVVHGHRNDCLSIQGAFTNARPYLEFRQTNGNRVMYLGYPDTSTAEVRVWADDGPLQLGAASTTNGVRSSTIYDSTANDWGVFIEANGRLGRTASTIRVKTNVEEISVEEATSILDLITWVRFNYIDAETGEAKDMVSFGAIAEWMDEAGLGEFVGYDDEGIPNMVRYNALWPLVARVQQSHRDRLAALEETVAELVGRTDG